VSKTAYLVLENGKIFEGKFFGAERERETFGEIVFTTGMTGYLETLTDNSYYGQIILQTFPLIGNYGVISPDFENSSDKKIVASAYIVKSWCEEPSNFRSEGNLDTFLKAQDITGVYGIDTREVTKIIRENGVMNAKITNNINDINFEEIKDYKITNAVENVSCKTIKEYKSKYSRYRVAMLDFGMKESVKQKLLDRDCDVFIMPYNETAGHIKLGRDINGIVLSDGPGNPADNIEIINNLKEIIKLNIPIFGIGLGHQLLALANGFRTKKLKYGHRGANQPVRDLSTGKVYITNQNHGYEVMTESVDDNSAIMDFENVIFKTCEGIKYKNYPHVFSVQFTPDDCESPHGTGFLFSRFLENMDICNGKRNKTNGGI